MKFLLACEGQSEVYLLKSLIKRGHLNFGLDLILDEPIKLRQLDKIAAIIHSINVEEEIIIYRVGDTLKDELNLDDFKLRENKIKQYKICTKTELEILVIIDNGWYQDYRKNYKNITPKAFLKQRMPKYEPESYFDSHDLIDAITEYKRIKKHKSDEYYLIDLILNKIK